MKKSRSSNSKKSASAKGKKSLSKSATAPAKRPSGKTHTVTSKTSKKSATSKRTASKSTAAPKRKSLTTRSSKKSVSKPRISQVRSSKTKKVQSGSRKAAVKQLTSSEGLERVFKDCLKDIYYAEKQLVKALKKMSKASANGELNGAFDTHMQETEVHVEKLDEIFELLEMRAQGKKCPAMDGLIEEANEQIQEFAKGPALDAALIVCAQKIEHYEIAAYGSLRTFAATLHHNGALELFEEILEEELNTDKKLTLISQIVNGEAYPEDEDTEDEDADEEMNDEDEIDEDDNDIIGIEIINVEYGDSDNNKENSDNNGLL
ncbi:MAG TPA: DUF892 family protein [Flavipsychrobacter sp.]|nr:DUF892 family protein [Flavipsychrobacter sp.]